jgi:hypothetical protein
LLCVGAALAGQLAAQAPIRLVQQTPFLREPAGLQLATLVPGVRLTPGRTSAGHIEATIQGWIFTASTKADRRDGFDLSVSVNGGENLRLAPGGAVFGRAIEGALFSRLSTQGNWTRIRRTGWVPRPALTLPPRTVVEGGRAALSPPPRESAAAPRALPESTATELRGTLRAGSVLQRGPDGAPLASLAAPGEVTIGQRDRGWVKVWLEGWVRQTDIDGAVRSKPAITGAMLRDYPDRFVGQTVDWRLQFLARQLADELRPEMPLGQPYLLARGPLPETGFVYVLLSKDHADRLQGLKPLDEISVMATVRAARTRYLATPVVELTRLSP